MISKSIVLTASLAIAAPAFAHGNASPAATVEGTVFQELVTVADLDLRDRRAQRALKSRLMRASEKVCIASEGVSLRHYMGGKENSCEMRTYRQAQSQIATAIARAERGEHLPSVALVVSHEVPRR